MCLEYNRIHKSFVYDLSATHRAMPCHSGTQFFPQLNTNSCQLQYAYISRITYIIQLKIPQKVRHIQQTNKTGRFMCSKEPVTAIIRVRTVQLGSDWTDFSKI